MTSNGIASGAAQVLSSTPPERLAEDAAAKAEREPVKEAKEPVAETIERPQQVPFQVYDSKGRIVPTPGTAGTDFMM